MKHLLVIASVALPLSASAATVINDSFTQASRTDAPDATGAQWFSSSAGSTIAYVQNSGVTLTTGTAGRHMLGYFTADGAPVSVANVGESVTVSFTFSLNGSPGGSASSVTAVRLGLFDSTAGTRVSADNTNATSTFNGYNGYIATLSPSAVASTAFRERTNTTDVALISTLGSSPNFNYTALSPAGTSQVLTFGSSYTATYTATKTLAGLELGLSFTGPGVSSYSLSAIAGTPSASAFDTLVFYTTSSVGDSVTITNLTVTSATAVPEPAAFAVLAGLGVLGAVTTRRRRA